MHGSSPDILIFTFPPKKHYKSDIMRFHENLSWMEEKDEEQPPKYEDIEKSTKSAEKGKINPSFTGESDL